MSGFAAMFNHQGILSVMDEKFIDFQQSVRNFKSLEPAAWTVSGRHCAAAKFNTLSSLHRELVVDEKSNSWLLAVGTVVNIENSPEDSLSALLSDYLEMGDDAFKALDGPFALLIYDSAADKLVVLTDPMGFVSVFYGQKNGYVYVATSALTIARTLAAPPNEYGVYHFLNVGSMYGHNTLFQGVKRLPPATLLEIHASGVEERIYWSPTLDKALMNLSLDETQDYACDLLNRIIRRHLARETKIWVDLTAGFDSRLVAMLLAHQDIPFVASCQGPEDSPDVRISKRIARTLGWEYQHMMLPEDWGRQRYGYFPMALGKGDGQLDLFKQSSVLWDQQQRARRFTTSVWGLGGELWRGTVWKQEFMNVGRVQVPNYDRLISYRVLSPLNRALLRDPSRIDWVRHEIKAMLKSIGDEFTGYPNTVQLDRVFVYKTTGHTGAHLSIVMGMQRALVPLYSKAGLVANLSLNYRWRQHSRLIRLLLERMNPTLAAFPTTDGGPALPMRWNNILEFKPYWIYIGKQLIRKASKTLLGQSILPSPKDEFAGYPLARWRRETLDDLASDRILEYTNMHSAELYDAEALQAFVEAAYNNDFNQETALSRIITVEMALRAVGVGF